MKTTRIVNDKHTSIFKELEENECIEFRNIKSIRVYDNFISIWFNGNKILQIVQNEDSGNNEIGAIVKN